MNCFNPVQFLLQESLDLHPTSHIGDVMLIMAVLPAGCSSFAHHYNVLGKELAICARIAKADWIFHFLYFCGCGRIICLQKGTSGSKLKKVPKTHIRVGFFFFSLVFDIFFPDQDWRRGESSREKRLEGGGEGRGSILKKNPLNSHPLLALTLLLLNF